MAETMPPRRDRGVQDRLNCRPSAPVYRNASDGFDHLWSAAADEADRSVVRNATSRSLVDFPQKIDSPNLFLKQGCRIKEGEFADPGIVYARSLWNCAELSGYSGLAK
jgi:hypothetical protein